MGQGEEIVQVVENSDDAIMVLISVMAEIRPLLQDEGLDFEQGFVLFAEDGVVCRQIQRFFKGAGTEQCKTVGRSGWKIPNNQIGIHQYNLYDKEKDIFEFLYSENFTPIVLSNGMIPDFLKARFNLLIFEQGIMHPSLLLHAFQEFCNNIHENPDLLQRQIRLCRTSIFFKEDCEKPLYLSLESAAEVFCDFYRESHDESETRQMRWFFHRAIVHHLELAECYAEDLETTDLIKKALENYIDENSWVQIGSVEEIDGELTKAVERDEAILFDGDFYYLPEKIVRSACRSFRNVASILSVKRALLESGFLHCNNAKEGNFTVKKLLTNVFGYTFRPRFLKISKKFFQSSDSLGLEERRKKCTLEISTENHAG